MQLAQRMEYPKRRKCPESEGGRGELARHSANRSLSQSKIVEHRHVFQTLAHKRVVVDWLNEKQGHDEEGAQEIADELVFLGPQWARIANSSQPGVGGRLRLGGR